MMLGQIMLGQIIAHQDAAQGMGHDMHGLGPPAAAGGEALFHCQRGELLNGVLAGWIVDVGDGETRVRKRLLKPRHGGRRAGEAVEQHHAVGRLADLPGRCGERQRARQDSGGQPHQKTHRPQAGRMRSCAVARPSSPPIGSGV